MKRWGTLTKTELQMIHHALRVLLTHPMRMPPKDDRLARRLADEIWDQHAADVAQKVARL